MGPLVPCTPRSTSKTDISSGSGFLSLETDEIPGNAGMLDQVAALQWVRDHIDVFGGNRNTITVMGESAGGASSSFLNISPLSTGALLKLALCTVHCCNAFSALYTKQ